jgi:hypothetical protein
MSDRLSNRIILGSLKYKSAPDIEQKIQVPFVQTTKENIEFDRTIDIELEQLYDDERQACDTFRPSCKLSLLFNNYYSGQTSYYPFASSLYYENVNSLIATTCVGNTVTNFEGYPQYYEFDFMRFDNNISGYTIPDVNNNVHVNFVNKKAYNYNWTYYVSYAYENDYTKSLTAVESTTNTTLAWNSGDGIPFVIQSGTSNGSNVIQFRCPVNHGLSVGESVQISFDYYGIDVFQVDFLGDDYFGSSSTIFGIFNPGFVGGIFVNGVTGTFKRIKTISNSADSKSIYYVRKHKILTLEDDAVITKSGFEQQIFKKTKKFEREVYTVNKQSRVSLKNSDTVYTLTFTRDIMVNPLRDNLIKPLSELYITIVWKGYFGWTFGVPKPGGGYYGLKQGWGFNLQPFGSSATPSPWWSNLNPTSDTNQKVLLYSTSLGSKPFAYIKPLTSGDTIDGELCEYNYEEQSERVLSDYYHKIKFNPQYFNIGLTAFNNNPDGYYYKVHYPITIKAYSDYIEDGNSQNVAGIPDYAYYSQTNNTFIWRDLYPYGYVDSNNIGVDYPFLNNAHYPYRDIIFRLIPEGTNYVVNNTVESPIIDNCE